MASRKEQKEQLRAERERKAREAEAAERRRKMIGFGAAGVLVVAAVAAIVVVLVSSGGDGNGGGDTGAAEPGSGDFQTVSIPEKGDGTDVRAAADAAGCKVTQHESEGRGHVSGRVEYKTNPPNSGSHNEFPAQDGAYTEDPGMETLVHALEHGRVILWYRPGADERLKGQLKTLFDEDTYHVLLAPNTREMPAQVAASSWTRTITCDEVNDKTWDALRLFRDSYRDQAPEQVP